MSMKILGVIPARYASTRFPGKPLVEIAGKTMIQRTYEQALKAKNLQKIVVATDDARILKHVIEFGGDAVLTADTHESGTDRCYEAMTKIEGKFDFVINIQGDEPFIKPDLIEDLAAMLDFKTEIATAVKKISDYESLFNPNVVKAVLTMRKQCLYFSRQAVPYVRGFEQETWLDHANFYKHIGIYAYRSDVLEQISHLPTSPLENTEKLEQLRWLGYGYKIYATITEHESIGIDTPDNLADLLAEEF
jgi:3-deoxy-manno-octulosonate cytidylyltransferase (CMP-KDO synthetase)